MCTRNTPMAEQVSCGLFIPFLDFGHVLVNALLPTPLKFATAFIVGLCFSCNATKSAPPLFPSPGLFSTFKEQRTSSTLLCEPDCSVYMPITSMRLVCPYVCLTSRLVRADVLVCILTPYHTMPYHRIQYHSIPNIHHNTSYIHHTITCNTWSYHGIYASNTSCYVGKKWEDLILIESKGKPSSWSTIITR